MKLKSKIYSFDTGFGTIAGKSEEIERDIEAFMEFYELNDKEIVSVSQSESDGRMYILTFIYKDE